MVVLSVVLISTVEKSNGITQEEDVSSFNIEMLFLLAPSSGNFIRFWIIVDSMNFALAKKK